jgi:hypothetical protein
MLRARVGTPTLLAEQKREPPVRQGGSRGGLAKRRTTNKLFCCEIGPIPQELPQPQHCAWVNEAQRGLSLGNTEAQKVTALGLIGGWGLNGCAIAFD